MSPGPSLPLSDLVLTYLSLAAQALHRDQDSAFDGPSISLSFISCMPLLTEPSCWLPVSTITRTHLDEEKLLSHLQENSQDAIITTLGLHWINDLPGQPLSRV